MCIFGQHLYTVLTLEGRFSLTGNRLSMWCRSTLWIVLRFERIGGRFEL